MLAKLIELTANPVVLRKLETLYNDEGIVAAAIKRQLKARERFADRDEKDTVN